MPVIGHVFVGTALASTGYPVVRSSARRWWLPLVVVLACLPDLATQMAHWVGVSDWQDAAHSMVVALPVSVLLALGLARWLRACWPKVFILVLVCLASHNLLDLLHGARRPLFWPLSTRASGVGDVERDPTLLTEILLYGGLAGAVWGIRLWLSKRRGARAATARCFMGGWAPASVVALILLAALVVNHCREVRVSAFARSRTLLTARQLDEALTAVDEAARRPHPIRRSRLDYMRAEIFLAKGDRQRAEECYVRSVADDPAYFWAVADLADFYASSGGSAEERRRLAAPYLQMLSCNFADFEAYPHYLAKINRKLAR